MALFYFFPLNRHSSQYEKCCCRPDFVVADLYFDNHQGKMHRITFTWFLWNIYWDPEIQVNGHNNHLSVVRLLPSAASFICDKSSAFQIFSQSLFYWNSFCSFFLHPLFVSRITIVMDRFQLSQCCRATTKSRFTFKHLVPRSSGTQLIDLGTLRGWAETLDPPSGFEHGTDLQIAKTFHQLGIAEKTEMIAIWVH